MLDIAASPQALALAVAVVAVAGLIRRAKQSSKRIVHGPSTLNDFVAKGLRPTVDQYTPAWWTNAHIQILLTFLIPHRRVTYQRELLTFEDGGQAALDWALESESQSAHKHLEADAPIVLILHGLTGSSVDMQSLCAKALDHGYRPVVFNKRGHGGVKLTTPKLQGFGCVRDLKDAIARIEQAFPTAKVYGIGISAGSGLLASYLGETGDDSRLEAGVMVSPGYDTFDLFCNGKVLPVYNFLMTISLKQLVQRHKNELKNAIDVSAALRAKNIREFDEHVYMKMHGYSDIAEYWKHNNPMRKLQDIKRPMLCINALDDPVCTKETIPIEIFQNDSRRMLVETERGSHCAFYQGHWTLENWSDKAALTYLDKVREFQAINERETNDS